MSLKFHKKKRVFIASNWILRIIINNFCFLILLLLSEKEKKYVKLWLINKAIMTYLWFSNWFHFQKPKNSPLASNYLCSTCENFSPQHLQWNSWERRCRIFPSWSGFKKYFLISFCNLSTIHPQLIYNFNNQACAG